MPFKKGQIKTGGRKKGSQNKGNLSSYKIDKMLSFFESFKDGSDFYVYAHFNSETNECFYIGKGKGRRAWAAYDRSDLWKKYTKQNPNYHVRVIVCDITEDESLLIESILIKSRMPLTNIQIPYNNIKIA